MEEEGYELGYFVFRCCDKNIGGGDGCGGSGVRSLIREFREHEAFSI